MGKLFIIVGLFLFIIGLLIILKIPIPLGQLPGDLTFKGKTTTFYFPITTCLLVSFLLSIIMYLFNRS